jgi:hypothetical protein
MINGRITGVNFSYKGLFLFLRAFSDLFVFTAKRSFHFTFLIAFSIMVQFALSAESPLPDSDEDSFFNSEPQIKINKEPVKTLPNSGPVNGKNISDYFYLKRDFESATYEYSRKIYENQLINYEDPIVNAKLGLTWMRRNDFRKSLEIMERRHEFTTAYLRMYASLKSGMIYNAVYEFDIIRNLPPEKLSSSQLDYANLLSGTLMLERGEYEKSLQYYKIFRNITSDDLARTTAEKIADEIENYTAIPKKKVWLAGILAAALPGSGHIYSGQTAAGITAFSVNFVLLGGAAYMYNLEQEAKRPHYVSGLFATGGLVFYGANVVGAVSAARRYNQYHERAFQQSIRDNFFNTDFIEDTSGVKFTTSF